jgi:hypothetical protein
MKSHASEQIRTMAGRWRGRLAHFRHHRHPEHLEALLEEAVRFAGLQLEIDLERSDFWSRQPLFRRALVLLYLVDRGVVTRRVVRGRPAYEVADHADAWIDSQTALAPYRVPTRELVAAIRAHQGRRGAP